MQVMLRVGNLLQIYGKSIPSAAKMGKPEQGFKHLLKFVIHSYIIVIKQCVQELKLFP